MRLKGLDWFLLAQLDTGLMNEDDVCAALHSSPPHIAPAPSCRYLEACSLILERSRIPGELVNTGRGAKTTCMGQQGVRGIRHTSA